MSQREFDQKLTEAQNQLGHAASAATHMAAALSRASKALEELRLAVPQGTTQAAANHSSFERPMERAEVPVRPELHRKSHSGARPLAAEADSFVDEFVDHGVSPHAAAPLAQAAPSVLPRGGGFGGFAGLGQAAPATPFVDGQTQQRAALENRPLPTDGEAAMVRRFNELLARSLAERIRPDPDAVLSALVAACGPTCKGSRRAAGTPGYLEVYLNDDQVLLFPPNGEIGHNTPHIGPLFDLEKSLPSGSAIQVVQPARVALADLKYPPAPGMVRKGRIKLVG